MRFSPGGWFMPGRRWLAVGASVLAAAMTTLAAGCSGGGGGGGGSTGLEAALGRVADTAGTRGYIAYDDTAALVQLEGGQVTSPTRFGLLAGTGTGTLVALEPAIKSDTGITVFGESYAISAGLAPKTVTLIAGGQDSSAVTSKLERLGWESRSGSLVLPNPYSQTSSGSGARQDYALFLPQVSASGSDVVVGAPAADLSLAGSPSGQTLADDPGISALASCLGDVVAAEFTSGASFAGHPVTVAVGIPRPASNTATVQVVTCVDWPTSAAAASYAAALPTAFASGTSALTGRRWSTLLSSPSVTAPGGQGGARNANGPGVSAPGGSTAGGQNVVRWQASIPGNPKTAFLLLQGQDLPALPGCRASSGAGTGTPAGCTSAG